MRYLTWWLIGFLVGVGIAALLVSTVRITPPQPKAQEEIVVPAMEVCH